MYDRVNREALWNVLKTHGVGGQVFEGIKVFNRVASACTRLEDKVSETFSGMHNVPMVVQYFCG